MSAPRRLRDLSPEDPRAAAVQRVLEPLADPVAPVGAKARVRARLDKSRRRGGLTTSWPLAGATMAAAVLILLVARGPWSTAPAPALAPARLAEAQTWRAPPDATLTLDLDLGRFELAPRAVLREAAVGGDELELLRGAVKVARPKVALRIVAGRFSVGLDAEAAARIEAAPFSVQVTEGQVQLTGPDGVHRLEAGQVWPPVEPEAEPREAESEPVAKAPAPRPRRAPAAAKVAPEVPAAPAAPDLGAIYRAARADSDPDRAVAAFDRVLAAGGPWAEMAGHQAVRRRMSQGRLEEALERLDALEARFVGGAHAPEVWIARVEIRVAQDALHLARADLDRYLARFPNSPRASDLFFLRAELLREQDQLEAARADYARVVRGRYVEAAQRALKKL